jgi:hypothetical protein
MESDGQKFLCAAHVPPRECCAIDYMCHILDTATSFVHNISLFPGRMDVPKKSADQFGSQIRRLYRIFLHCYSAHKNLFAQFETNKLLCKRFTVFARHYKYLDDETLTVPTDITESSEDEDTTSEEEE